jgi:hypothetical protein
MKIALCLSGQPRFFKTSYTLLKKYILDSYDCDLFIDTWNINIHESVEGLYRYKDEGSLEELYNIYKPRIFKVESLDEKIEEISFNFEKKVLSKDFQKLNWPSHIPSTNHFISRYYCMLYKIYNCNKIKNEYAKIHEINYDITIRARMDLVYEKSPDIINDGILYTDSFGNGRFGPGDTFAFSNTNNMDIYSNLFLKLDEYIEKNEVPINTEFLLQYHIENNNILWKNINLAKDVIRPYNKLLI